MKSYHRLFAVALLWLTGALRTHQIAALGTQADEGIHITIAEQLSRGHGRLYEDLFENRTPGAEWLLATLFKLSSPTILMGRVAAVSMAMLTAAALYVAARELLRALASEPPTSRLAGYAALTLFALAPLPLFWARFTMLEHFAAAAATGSIAISAFALNRPSRRLWVVAGLLAGLAALFKQTELILAAAMFIFFISFGLQTTYKRMIRAGLLWLAGYAIPVLLLLVVLILQGTLNEFLHFLSGAERLAPFTNVSQKWLVLWPWAVRRPVVPLSIFGLGVALWKRTPGLILVATWALFAGISLLLPEQLDLTPGGFSHYVIVPMAAAALLSGSGLMAGWQYLWQGRAWQRLTVVVLLLVVLATVPGWLSDLRAAIEEDDYPQPGFASEMAIGEAAALLTPENQPMIVLGNSIFFHWANRPPSTRFFHYPEYFNQAAIGEEATAEVVRALTESRTRTVLVSRFHLQDRLPDEILSTLRQNWTPVARFPYPYQQDIFLFRRRVNQQPAAALAEIGQDIRLVSTEIEQLNSNTYLLQLLWQAREPLNIDYTVFVHVRNAQGQLITQADAVPGVGFRPTTSWQADEIIVDYHWLTLPPDVNGGEQILALGLYNAENNERLPVQSLAGGPIEVQDAFTIPLQPQGNE